MINSGILHLLSKNQKGRRKRLRFSPKNVPEILNCINSKNNMTLKNILRVREVGGYIEKHFVGEGGRGLSPPPPERVKNNRLPPRDMTGDTKCLIIPCMHGLPVSDAVSPDVMLLLLYLWYYYSTQWQETAEYIRHC